MNQSNWGICPLLSIDGKHDGRSIFLNIAVLAARNPIDLTHKVYTGLLDTGATRSWITPRVIFDLNLPEIGRETVSVATEERVVTSYLFRLALFSDEPNITQLPYVFPDILGFRLAQRANFDVLIGMDILCQTNFYLRNDRSWTLQFG